MAGSPVPVQAFNEGLTSPSTGGAFYYELPYSIFMPKRSEVTNLFAPNCPSATHVAFAGIRVEPTLWRLGQACGTAIVVALKSGNNVVVQDVNVTAVQSLLWQQGVQTHYPFREHCQSPVPPPPPPPSPPKCKVYVASGAGTAWVNGNYTFTGMQNNAPAFMHSSNSSIYRCELGEGGGGGGGGGGEAD